MLLDQVADVDPLQQFGSEAYLDTLLLVGAALEWYCLGRIEWIDESFSISQPLSKYG
jgi:hypothetical protein